MDAYASNFKRTGVESGKDLVYFSKLENYRYYTYKDLEVRQGRAKKGDRKPGEQMHVQVIVSRKDASNSIKPHKFYKSPLFSFFNFNPVSNNFKVNQGSRTLSAYLFF